MIRSILVAAGMAAASVSATACSSGAHRSLAPEATGTLALPLTTVANGVTYRLFNASVTIYNSYPFGGNIYLTDGNDGGAAELSTSLPAGNYNAQLNYGWTLERLDAAGNFRPVVATLQSSYIPFTIYNGTTTTIDFVFQTDGVAVVVGAGTVDIGFVVDASKPACTELGADCPAGSWCPPASLTGADLVCVPAGSVAFGSPCLGPADCVANASCFQLADAGSVCVPLCLTDGTGPACAAGMVCHAIAADAGTDFGICQ